MKMIDYKEYLRNANITFTLNKCLRFKGINYNVMDSKVLDNGTLWYSGVAHRHTGKKNVLFSIIAIINTDGTQTATIGTHLMD